MLVRAKLPVQCSQPALFQVAFRTWMADAAFMSFDIILLVSATRNETEVGAYTPTPHPNPTPSPNPDPSPNTRPLRRCTSCHCA